MYRIPNARTDATWLSVLMLINQCYSALFLTKDHMRRRGTTGSWDDHLVSLRTAVQGFIVSAKILLFSSYNRILCLYNKIYLADFLKTNLTKFAVISSKRRQKAGFLNLRSSMVTKEKERRKRKSEEKKRRRREKSDGCTLSFCNNHFGDRFWPRKTVGRKRPIWQ